MTGADVAHTILEKNGIYDVAIEHAKGNLTTCGAGKPTSSGVGMKARKLF